MSTNLPTTFFRKNQIFIKILNLFVGKNGLTTNHRKIGISGLSLVVLGILFLTVLFPVVLDSIIRKHTTLGEGSFMRKMWAASFPYEFRVYLFNVTNPEEIARGQKPIVSEVGPYVYDVWQEKTEIVDHEVDDTMSYSVKNTYFFNAEKSKNLSDDDELTLAHFTSLGTPNAILKNKPKLISAAIKIVDTFVSKPNSVFVRIRVKDYLFDGLPIQCDGVEEFFSRAVCNQLIEEWDKFRFVKATDTLYMYSVWGSMNTTDFYNQPFRVRRGIKKIEEVGELVEYNNVTNISVWGDDDCDAFAGTDGTIFHPFIDIKKNIYVTNTRFCRRLTYSYDSDIDFDGISLLRYSTSLGTDLQTNPNDKCFCIAPNRCLENGVFELWKCFKNALVASNPHFYLADPYYVSAVDGLQPYKDKHMTTIDLDPVTGWPVRTQFRIQINLELMKLPKYRLMENFPEAMLPLVWVDQVTTLMDPFLKKIKYINLLITLARTLSGLLILTGFLLCCFATFHEYRLNMAKQAQKAKVKKFRSEHKTLAAKNGNGTDTISNTVEQARLPISID